MYYEDKYENGVCFYNFPPFFQISCKNKLIADFHKVNVGITFVETRSIILDNVFPYLSTWFNEHLTELLLAGIIEPFIWDIVKTSVIKGWIFAKKFYNKTSKKQACMQIVLEFKNKKVRALLPNDFTEEQMNMYMDNLKKLLKTIRYKDKNDEKLEEAIIEYEEKNKDLKLINLSQFAEEQVARQKSVDKSSK